jgi:hypothetical protein
VGMGIRGALGMNAFQVQVFFLSLFWGLSHYDWLNPKEKAHHTLKVAQYKNFYLRWVVDFFFKILFCIDNFCEPNI